MDKAGARRVSALKKIENQVFRGFRISFISRWEEREEEPRLPLVPTCWAWKPPGPSSFQACGHLGGSATEKQVSGGAHGSVGSWGRARRAPRPPCLGLKSSPPFYSCVILITMEFSKWAPCWTKTRILGILPSYTPVDERSWLNNYSLIPECRLHAWKYMVHQRLAKSMTIFFFLVLVFFALFPFSHTPSSF